MSKIISGLVLTGATVAAGVAVMAVLDRRARNRLERAIDGDIARLEDESPAPPPSVF